MRDEYVEDYRLSDETKAVIDARNAEAAELVTLRARVTELESALITAASWIPRSGVPGAARDLALRIARKSSGKAECVPCKGTGVYMGRGCWACLGSGSTGLPTGVGLSGSDTGSRE